MRELVDASEEEETRLADEGEEDLSVYDTDYLSDDPQDNEEQPPEKKEDEK